MASVKIKGRKLLCLSKKVSKNYAFEIAAFYLVRDFRDGIDFCDFSVKLDVYKGDHNPRFSFTLIVLNFTLLEIEVYNIHHVDHDEGFISGLVEESGDSIEKAKITSDLKWLCSVCGLVPVNKCPQCGLNEDDLLER
jgi:hypothetical protein